MSPLTSVSHLSNSFLTADNKALAKIYKKIKQETSHMNGLAFAGELRETIKMLKHPYSSMANLVNRHLDLLSKRKKGLRGPSKYRKEAWVDIISSTWLETQFGMKPVIADAQSIAESIARAQVNPTKRKRVQARESTANRSVTKGTLQVVPNSLIVYSRTDEVESEYTAQWTCGLAFTESVNSTALQRAPEVLGFTLENFIPALYEVLPWSWLFDYFSNLGDIIEAGTTSTRNVTWSVKTTRENTVGTAYCVPDSVGSANRCNAFGMKMTSLVGNSLGMNSIVRRTVTRTMLPLSIPVFELSYPEKLGQWGNIIAVMAQRRKTVENIRF